TPCVKPLEPSADAGAPSATASANPPSRRGVRPTRGSLIRRTTLAAAVLGTYGSFLLLLGLAALSGQAIFAVCGRRTWSRLAPAVGLAALSAIAWGTVRLPGHGTASLVAILVVGAASALFLWRRLDDLPRALRVDLPVALAGALAASLPFFVARRFGILGTGLDPDMSQHLLAAFQLAHGEGGRLISTGYPLGPHSLVVAVSALGVSFVHGFDGLSLAAAVARSEERRVGKGGRSGGARGALQEQH